MATAVVEDVTEAARLNAQVAELEARTRHLEERLEELARLTYAGYRGDFLEGGR